MNALEALRVVLSIVLLFGTMFAFMNSDRGGLALPKIMRERIKFRRRTQMLIFGFISIILGIQSMYVSVIPNPIEPSLATWTSNLSVLSTLILLLISTGIHTYGWWREGVIMKIPLNPDAEERAQEAVERARVIAHASKSVGNIAILTLESLEKDENISPGRKPEIRMSITNVEHMLNQIDELHEEIRMLQPLVVSSENANTTK